MYLKELQLVNVRQFENRVFKFQPGFNLIVGENGAGKTTLLRSILAVFARSNHNRQRSTFTDQDIRLRTNQLNILAKVEWPGNQFPETFTYSRPLGGRASRSRQDKPLVLSYASNEATCGSFVSRRIKRYSNQPLLDAASSEEWIFQQENPPVTAARSQPNFGRSQNIREFVRSILFKFSTRFRDFRWDFEPFECNLIPPDKKDDASQAKTQKSLETLVMRHLQEKENTLHGVDQPSVTIDSRGYIVGVEDGKQVIPSLSELLKNLEASSQSSKYFERFTVKVSLTPKIRILDDSGDNFLLSQLSDGEQRLFSLFVDIARNLSIEVPNDANFTVIPAIILIDEIDVHLHPKWQRIIVLSLEELFPACQFIATTHSPFIIQPVPEYKVQDLNNNILGSFTDRGIEEIAVKVMDIQEPSVSRRYLEMVNAAKEYLLALEETNAEDDAKVEELKNKLDVIEHRYARNPAYQAFLELRRDGKLGTQE